MENTYVLVEFPESQEYMEEDWFAEEAVLHVGLPSAYFIPEHRLINNDYIVQRVEELAQELTATEEQEREINDEWENGSPFEGGISTFEAILSIKMFNSEV